MNFNWGTGITIFYILFVAAVATVLIASFSVDHSLVVEEYYAQDLAYQSIYDKKENSLRSAEVDIKREGNHIVVDFRHERDVEGTIYFYRASDKSKDFVHNISSSRVKIPVDNLLPGKWRLNIDWKEGSTPYYKEEYIVI